MRYNKNDIGDEIVFDRDTSAPKEKMKNRRRMRRPQQQQEEPNTNTINQKLNSDKSSEIKNKIQPKVNNLTANTKKSRNSININKQNINNNYINDNSNIDKKDNENEKNNNKEKEIENEQNNRNNQNKKDEEEKNKNINDMENNEKNNLNKNNKNENYNNDNDINETIKKGNKQNKKDNGRSDNSSEENKSTKNNNNKNNQKNKNSKNNNNNANANNVDKQDAFIQVNLLNEKINEERKNIEKQYKIKESEYKEKIYNLKEDIENIKDENKQLIINLKNEINSKKEEIIRLTNLNSKLKRNVEKMSEKINNLYNKMLEKNKLNNINYNNNSNKFKTYNANNDNEINGNNNNSYNLNNNNNSNSNLNEIIKIKDKQIRDGLSMISYLTKEKNRLKEELFNLKDQTKNMNNSAIINKNKINLLKTTNKFTLKSPNQNNNSNLEISNENENIDENKNMNINNADQNNVNDIDSVYNENDLLQRRIKYGSTIFKNMLLKSKNNMNKRAISSANLLEKKKLQENVHVKMNKLFNDEERKALSTLFKNAEEFEYFNQKINALHNHNTSIEKKLVIKIKNLKIDNDDKDEQIQYLQEKLRECETKLKIMENKYNYEKFMLKQTKKASLYNSQTSVGNSVVKKTFQNDNNISNNNSNSNISSNNNISNNNNTNNNTNDKDKNSSFGISNRSVEN